MASSESSSVGLAITMALFLHKAPEAAGYGTFVMHKGVPTANKIKYCLVS